MDVSQYLEIFIDETEEHLQTLSDCIKELEKERIMKGTIQYGRSTCQFFQKYYSG